MAMMRAIMIKRGGQPEVLEIGYCVKPQPVPGLVLIRVMAFGINRSEVVARQFYQPSDHPVRVLGVEAVGVVEAAPGGEFLWGKIVATAMGALPSQQFGSYAEYVCVPAKQVRLLRSGLDWATLGAMPHMFSVAYGSLFKALRVQRGETLLIRGGTTSVGLAATAMATDHGVNVTGTTRNEDHTHMILKAGAKAAVLDHGSLAGHLPCKFDKVLELVGTTTLLDSMRCVKKGGVVCAAGMVSGHGLFDQFIPMASIPNLVRLTTYCGDGVDFMQTPLQHLVNRVEAKKLFLPIAKVFRFEEIVQAHRFMEENHGTGKIVVTNLPVAEKMHGTQYPNED